MLVHQDLDCFAYNSAAHAERLAEFILDREHFVGLELSAHDATAELVDDVLMQAQRKLSAIRAH